MTHHIALLRGINVGGHRKVPMADLRRLATDIGLSDVQTYVASGNLVFASDDEPAKLEARLERIIADTFGFPVDVVMRSAARWLDYAAHCPFDAEGKTAPNLVMLCLGKRPATDDDLAALRRTASGNERADLIGDALWLYFADGSARSKMTLGPKAGVWTTRNLRSVHKIAAMLG